MYFLAPYYKCMYVPNNDTIINNILKCKYFFNYRGSANWTYGVHVNVFRAFGKKTVLICAIFILTCCSLSNQFVLLRNWQVMCSVKNLVYDIIDSKNVFHLKVANIIFSEDFYYINNIIEDNFKHFFSFVPFRCV